MRLAAVLDGTIGSTERQARALGAFLREGVLGDLAAETVLFYEDEGDRDRLVALSPTRDVRLDPHDGAATRTDGQASRGRGP